MVKIKNRPVVLLILDGYGIAPPAPGNAISQAKKPNIDKYIATYPALSLVASGESVGLAWGEMGTSEIGHQNIGSGQIIYQSLPRINKTISDGSFFQNEAFLQAINHAKKNKSKLHLMGLVSSGGVHSHIDHLFALLKLAKEQKVDEVYIHVILDGRDSIYNTGKSFVEELLNKIKELKSNAKISDIAGRFYTMDRDNHWERIEKAFNAMTKGESDEKFEDPIAAIESSYKKQIYDEEFIPVVITKKGKPVGLIEDKDAVIFFNFRADRARQITEAFILPGFDKFPVKNFSKLFYVGMMQYDKDLPLDAFAFAPIEIKNPLAKILSDAGLKQLHIAETEKYAHVTYFLTRVLRSRFQERTEL